MTTISIGHVSKRFGPPGTAPVLGDIELEIPEGQFVALLGSSGCGKTTLLRIVGGLESATSGQVSIGGHPVTGGGADRRKALSDVGFVFQEHNLLPWRSALRNVQLPLAQRRMPARERVEVARQMLELVSLGHAERRLPHELSGGMRQRVAIARALSYDPAVLLMDEPFGALDAQTRDNLNLELQRIWLEKQKTVVFVTHSIQEAVFLADRVVVMQAGPGRVVADVTIDLERPRGVDVMATARFAEYTGVLREALTHGPAADGAHGTNGAVA
ncbi:ABC transporter [Nocardioides gansuensis]|uniref:ABC transporter n=1 Tax=Nocardioides gansuensis TaxID=2138300 RepID=A0A2T8F4Z6_9ACTN|nr:ABC transporter ATP-binding protein [Nocardioides gansuensis]PVG80781.1 ABC transporter [Nocardioides gansuensis]